MPETPDIAPITGTTVWTREDFSGKEDLCVDIAGAALADLTACEAAVADRALDDIGIEAFTTPGLTALMAEIRQRLTKGCGLAVLRGLPVETHGVEAIARMFWGLGLHLGCPASQSVMGERMGHVINASATDPNARGYRNRYQLDPHTDFQDVLTFLCISQGVSGGKNWFVSSHEVHNQILRDRPDLLRVLYRGYFTHRVGEQSDDEAPITEYRVPVFSEKEGHVSCRLLPRYIANAAHEGTPLTPQEDEALQMMRDLTMQEGNGFFFGLEPGEAVFINNYVVLHGRTAFEEGGAAGAQRHLLRLWLTANPTRPVVPEIFIYDSERQGLGIAPRAGGVPSYDDSQAVARTYTT